VREPNPRLARSPTDDWVIPAQSARSSAQSTPRAGQVDAALNCRLGRAALLVPPCEPVPFAQLVPQGPGVPQSHVEREERAAPGRALARDAHGDARGVVAEDQPNEAADRPAAGVESRQTPDQVEEQVLSQVVEIGMWEPQLALQATRRGVGFSKEDVKIGG